MTAQMRRWLKLDAANRAWRTVLQGVVVTIGSAAVDAAVQVYRRAVVESMAGRPFDGGEVFDTAQRAVLFAAAMALAAYLHRRVGDPSRVPSGQPTAPPVVTGPAAAAGAMRPGQAV